MCTESCEDGNIKLFGSTNPTDGGVAVCKDERWWAISSSGGNWGTNEAVVVCHQLQLSRKSKFHYMITVLLDGYQAHYIYLFLGQYIHI